MSDAMLHVNPARLRSRLERMSEFGRPPGGTFADGVTRVGYSEADKAARAWLADLMKGAGLDVRIDAAANVIGRKEGLDGTAAPILFGSHGDSVVAGGNFDGALGVLAAIEVVQVLAERGVTTAHPLEVVVWTNEEGVAYGDGLCGSRAAAGEWAAGELDKVWNGVRKADAVRALGGVPERISEARRAPGSVHAYLELHIEQGGVLERAAASIGVVEGIVAIHRCDVLVRGVANHAGTTPMEERRDALLAAARLVDAVHDVATMVPGRQVGTVGRLEVTPNAPNVIPGRVRLTVELRDLSEATLRDMARQVAARAAAIAAATKTVIEFEPLIHHDGALASPEVQTAIALSADGLGLTHLSLPSGAGHDAQMMARICPMGMIFVPSAGGISHSPREWTSWEDCARGAEVLLESVLAVDGLQLGTASGI
jgi:beta-ureidopropionase / N-carbamoyl-L-amino-acid hydrolase